MNKKQFIVHFADGFSSIGYHIFLLKSTDSGSIGAVSSIEGYVEYSAGASFIAVTEGYGDTTTIVRVYPKEMVSYFEEADPTAVKRDMKLTELEIK